MIKRLLLLIGLTLLLVPVTAVSAVDKSIEVFIDNEKINFNEYPMIENGTTLVQFRPVFEKLGLQVGWDGETQIVTGSIGSFTISLQISNPVARINEQDVPLALAPRLVDGNTFVPLRFIGEASERSVVWNGDTRTITITSTLPSYIHDVMYADTSRLTYNGDMKTGNKDGAGKLYDMGKLWYEGQFRDNKLDGKGKLYDPTGQYVLYEGQFSDNKMNGKGILFYKNGAKAYEGQWVYGFKNGKGTAYTESKNLLYEGNYLNDLYNDEGKLYDAVTGKLAYQGTFKAGKSDGSGNAYDAAGILRYTGEFKNGQKHGLGKSYSDKGMLNYEGEYMYDMRNGYGTMYFTEGSTYVGSFKNGKFDGQGSYYNQATQSQISGLFKDGYYGNINRPIISYEMLGSLAFITTDYSNGFSYRRDSGTIISRKISISTSPDQIAFNYWPEGYTANWADSENLVTIHIMPKQAFQNSPSMLTKISEINGKVFAYTMSSSNLYPKDTTPYIEFNQALKEMGKLLENFKVFDINDY